MTLKIPFLAEAITKRRETFPVLEGENVWYSKYSFFPIIRLFYPFNLLLIISLGYPSY